MSVRDLKGSKGERGMIPQDKIDQVLDKLDIVEVLGGYIQIKKAGRNFKGCCPFHNEKTPSFVVSPDKQIYHCFGCGAGGNVIGFVMHQEQLSFPEAVRMLAERVDITIPDQYTPGDGDSNVSEQLYNANAIAAEYYHDLVLAAKGRKALEYLFKRGIKKEALIKYKIGYAPDEWESLHKFSFDKKISRDVLAKSGLSVESKNGKSSYDRFRNRIIYPIFNERGKIVAFGARVMDDSLPKYINSPETKIYNKSGILYGLNFAKKGIRDKGYVIIVEGYMDVVIPDQLGVNNAVATSGTALTTRQVSILKKYSDTAVIVYDSDQAGQAASLRGLDVLLSNDMFVKVATLPKGDDPDSYVSKNGADEFYELVDQAKDLFDYKLDLMLLKYGGKDTAAKVRIVNEMLPLIAKVTNTVIRSDYLKKLSQSIIVDENSLRQELKKVTPDYTYKHEKKERVIADNSDKSTEIHILGLALSDKKLFKEIDANIDSLIADDGLLKNIFNTLKELYVAEEQISIGKLLGQFSGDPLAEKMILDAAAQAEITKDKKRVLKDCIETIKKGSIASELKALTAELTSAHARNDEAEVKNILHRINEIHKQKVS